MSDNDDALTTEFELDEPTKNTLRMDEDPEQAPISGKFYLKKWAAENLPGIDDAEDLQRIKMTIEEVDE